MGADGKRDRFKDMMRGVLGAAQELAWPTRCLVCDEPGELLCEDCRSSLPWISQRWACPNCGAPNGWLACTECGRTKGELWETRSCVCALPLEGAARKLVVGYKDASERRLAPVIAAAMEAALVEATAWPADDGAARFDPDAIDAVCFVPATSVAYRRRGFDHMEEVAGCLAAGLGLPVADVLARPQAQDQRGLSKQQRALNSEGVFELVGDVSGCSLLLVDDVVTTGSSLRAGARALLCAGASEVVGCALARAW